MNRILYFAVLTAFFSACQSTKPIVNSSSNTELMSVGGKSVSIGEFEYAYLKNNHLNKEAKDTEADIAEYLELYKKFKLKVIEAESLGRDTTKSFLSEFETYESQLAEPYLAISKVSDTIIREGFERMKQEVRASHILFRIEEGASEAQINEVYNLAMNVRERAINGEDFSALAREMSDDPSAETNGGDLGYFTAMQMVLPFEIAAYDAQPGEITEPVRSRFGYHVIKVVDKIPVRDEIKVAHIMLMHNNDGDSTKVVNKINSIYSQLQQGESWETLALSFSEDEYTKNNAGELPFIRPGRIDPDFEEIAFGLKTIGSYSKPFQTRYGWHIVKLIEKKKFKTSFEEAKPQIEQNLSRYGKYINKERSAIDLLKANYSYKLDEAQLESCKASILDTASAVNLDFMIFEFDNIQYNCADFTQFVSQKKPFSKMTESELSDAYTAFESQTILSYEKDVLLNKNGNYKYLRQEYKDGILLFSIMEDSVWNKASADTTGLIRFYEKNKKNYPSLSQAKGIKISAADSSILVKTINLLEDLGKDSVEIVENEINKTNPLNVVLDRKTVEKGKVSEIDDFWQKGTVYYQSEGRYNAFIIEEVKPAGIKPLKSIKGKVISDYQNQIEKDWISDLAKKYPVVVNENAYKSLVQKLSNEESK